MFPLSQTSSGETFATKSARTEDGARSDIEADGFWECDSKRHFLMSEFSIPMLPPTTPPHYPAATEDMRTSKRENTSFASVRLNGHHSPPPPPPPLPHSPLLYWRHGQHRHNYLQTFGITASRQMGYIVRQSDHGLASLPSILSLLRSSIQCIRGARSHHGHAIHLPSSIELTVSCDTSVLVNTCYLLQNTSPFPNLTCIYYYYVNLCPSHDKYISYQKN